MEGNGSGGAAAASRLSKPISSLSLSLSVFCLNSSRDKISIKSLRIFFKIGWTDAVSGREERRGREGERERKRGRERRGGRLSSRKEDYHRRKNDGGIQPYDSPRPRPSGFLLSLFFYRSPFLFFSAPPRARQHKIICYSTPRSSFKDWGGTGEGGGLLLNERWRRVPPLSLSLYRHVKKGEG